MAFYFYGVLGLVWCVLMFFFGYDSPAEHPTISKAEKFYIENSLGHTKEKTVRPYSSGFLVVLKLKFQKYPTPWKAILTSGPVWALFITQTGNNYCFWTLLTQIPSYMNYVMHFNIKDVSLLLRYCYENYSLFTEQLVVVSALSNLVAVKFWSWVFVRFCHQQRTD